MARPEVVPYQTCQWPESRCYDPYAIQVARRIGAGVLKLCLPHGREYLKQKRIEEVKRDD